MTDETPHPHEIPHPHETAVPDETTADERDAELAARLVVPPLDASTRASLVQAALDDVDAGGSASDADEEVSGPRSGRIAALGIAAALVIGAVVGTVIVTQPSDEGAPVAARASSTTAASDAAKAAAPGAAANSSGSAEAPAAASAPAAELGDLGEVQTDEAVRAVINHRLEAGIGPTPASIPCMGGGPGGATSIYGLVAITAAGTLTFRGSSVVVLVGPTPAGQSVAVLLDPERGCEFMRFVEL